LNILKEIVSKKNRQIKYRKRNKPLISFSNAILKKNKKKQLALISEIKPKSPSEGNLREIQDPITIAKTMQEYGASCISVLTEPYYFGGNIENLFKISENVSIPLLRKDFITSEEEIEESYNYNADAVLIIIGLVKEKAGKLFEKCKEIGMEALIEVHTEEEVQFALDIGAEIIGINNRNLNTMQTDISTTERLRKLIPQNKIVISESGIKNRNDAEYIALHKINAILVGSTIMKSTNIGSMIENLSSVEIL